MNSPAQQLAVQLANNNQGNTSPNPSVGAVIVKDNEIIGLGCDSTIRRETTRSRSYRILHH
jgi:Pyrimidine deaminase